MTLHDRLQEAFDQRVGGTAMLPASDLLSAMTRIEQLESAEQDAARYRWLRQKESWIPNRSELPSPFCGLVKWIGSAYSENEIDDLVDYAMKEMK